MLFRNFHDFLEKIYQLYGINIMLPTFILNMVQITSCGSNICYGNTIVL